MTKNEIIRELVKINPRFIKSLGIIYHNRGADVKHIFIYEYTTHVSHERLRELACVVLSLWKLRKFVVDFCVEYFPFEDDGECVSRSFHASQYVTSVSDFIKTIKK